MIDISYFDWFFRSR